MSDASPKLWTLSLISLDAGQIAHSGYLGRWGFLWFLSEVRRQPSVNWETDCAVRFRWNPLPRGRWTLCSSCRSYHQSIDYLRDLTHRCCGFYKRSSRPHSLMNSGYSLLPMLLYLAVNMSSLSLIPPHLFACDDWIKRCSPALCIFSDLLRLSAGDCDDPFLVKELE